jgi:ketosteroid isomerase-like protein
MTMDDAARRAANKQVFADVQATISAGEFDRLGDFMVDDLVFELPYGPAFMPNPIEGLEAWNQMQLMTFAMFDSFKLESTELHDCLDPDELIAEYRSEAKVKRNGNDYVNRYIGVLRFRDGKISHWREFHNPQATEVL